MGQLAHMTLAISHSSRLTVLEQTAPLFNRAHTDSGARPSATDEHCSTYNQPFACSLMVFDAFSSLEQACACQEASYTTQTQTRVSYRLPSLLPNH